MTRKIAAILAAAAALGLSACASPEGLVGAETADTSTANARVMTGAPEAATVDSAPAAVTEDFQSELDKIAERAYLKTVAPYTYPSEEDALMVGYAACALLDGGSTPATLAAELVFADGPVWPGFLNDELPHFYGAAMGSLCAEYGERFFG